LTSHLTSHYNEKETGELKMASWQVQDAKARFSELLEATLKNGPQVVTRRGIETAVMIPFEEWQRLQDSSRPSLKELLLAKGPRFENIIVKRRNIRRRPRLDLE
jgi:antitoxin Phd